MVKNTTYLLQVPDTGTINVKEYTQLKNKHQLGNHFRNRTKVTKTTKGTKITKTAKGTKITKTAKGTKTVKGTKTAKGTKVLYKVYNDTTTSYICLGCIYEDNKYENRDIKDMIDKALHELYLTEKVEYTRGKIEKVERQEVAGSMYYISFQATKSDCFEDECPIAECSTSVVHKEWLNVTYVVCVECEMNLALNNHNSTSQ